MLPLLVSTAHERAGSGISGVGPGCVALDLGLELGWQAQTRAASNTAAEAVQLTEWPQPASVKAPAGLHSDNNQLQGVHDFGRQAE